MVDLSASEQAMLAGEAGSGTAMAMRLVVGLADAMGATELLPITRAHIDSCLYHGRSGIDFVQRLVDGGGRVVIPTTLNVSSLDLLHPELYRGDRETATAARELMDGYVALGCEPTWTCAPYQHEQHRPEMGEHVAWAESNAIVFANSVLGARTHRYGDFIDIAAAITGRVPDAGLHRSERRRATMVVDVSALPDRLLDEDVTYPCLGHELGRRCGSGIPAIVGLPATTGEDRLKALGAAAASSGAVAMFHAVGLTPEAATLDAALGGAPVDDAIRITVADLRAARDALTSAAAGSGDVIRTVSLGTPHYSVNEIGRLHRALAGRPVHADVDCYVNTSRGVLQECMLRGWVETLERAGLQFVTDTCTYITPIVRDTSGTAMTDSAKWAYYAPANIGVQVVFGTLGECVESAVTGRLERDDALWAELDG